MSRNARPYTQNRHTMKMPAVAMSPTVTSGVSAANCVAAIDVPACQPFRPLPARK